ncbi:MAG TPA: hypothetical protein VK139_04285 [Microbacteriaceae bacterium]|nr:hypothetical protein [Microbacteriaceae bacterium]
MTEPIYDFVPPPELGIPVDDPETQALLAVMEHDPDWLALKQKLDEQLGRQLEYHCVVMCSDGVMTSIPVPATTDEWAIRTFDSMVLSWHNSRSLFPFSTLEEKTRFPRAVRLELLSPDGCRRLADIPLRG